MLNILVIYMLLICVKCELGQWASCIFHSFKISTVPVIYVTIDSFICKDAHTCFVMNIFPQLHVFTENNLCTSASCEVLYKIDHVDVKLAIACNKMWYCKKARCFCNHFIIWWDFWNLLGFQNAVCLFVFQGKMFSGMLVLKLGISYLSGDLWDIHLNYVSYLVCSWLKVKKIFFIRFNMANIYQRPPIRACLKYLCADLI